MNIEVNQKDINEVKMLALALGGNADRVLTRALRHTVKGVRTDVSTEIRNDLNLTKKYVDKNIKINGPFGRPAARVDTKSKPVGLINFKGVKKTPTKFMSGKGVRVKVKTKGKAVLLRHAFIQRAKNALNVFTRDPKKVPYRVANTKRRYFTGIAAYPSDGTKGLLRLTGPRLTDNLGRPVVIKRVTEKAGDRYLKRMDYEVTRELRR